MSSRWYPIYQKGNPQLRVFLPNFWLKLIRPVYKQPSNIVQFHAPPAMTNHDIKNYLEQIYKVPVAHIRSDIVEGNLHRVKQQGYIVKDDDYRRAFVTLKEGESFKFPEICKTKSEQDEAEMQKLRKDTEEGYQKFKDRNKDRTGLPGVACFFLVEKFYMCSKMNRDEYVQDNIPRYLHWKGGLEYNDEEEGKGNYVIELRRDFKKIHSHKIFIGNIDDRFNLAIGKFFFEKLCTLYSPKHDKELNFRKFSLFRYPNFAERRNPYMNYTDFKNRYEDVTYLFFQDQWFSTDVTELIYKKYVMTKLYQKKFEGPANWKIHRRHYKDKDDMVQLIKDLMRQKLKSEGVVPAALRGLYSLTHYFVGDPAREARVPHNPVPQDDVVYNPHAYGVLDPENHLLPEDLSEHVNRKVLKERAMRLLKADRSPNELALETSTSLAHKIKRTYYMEEGFHIYGSIRNLKMPIPAFAENVILDKNIISWKSFDEYIFPCGTIIYNISREKSQIIEAKQVLGMLIRRLEEISEDRRLDMQTKYGPHTFIVISSLWTWEKTPIKRYHKIVKEKLGEQFLYKRIPHEFYQEIFDAENYFLDVAKQYQHLLKIIVIGCGMTYGPNSPELGIFLKWGELHILTKKFPIIENGKNKIPVLNERDFLRNLYFIMCNCPSYINYFILCEKNGIEQQLFMMKFYEALMKWKDNVDKKKLKGKVKNIEKESSINYCNEIKILNYMSSNMNIRALNVTRNPKLFGIHETFSSSGMNTIRDYVSQNKQKPLRICVIGPYEDRAKLSVMLSKYYQLPLIAPKHCLQNYYKNILEKIENDILNGIIARLIWRIVLARKKAVKKLRIQLTTGIILTEMKAFLKPILKPIYNIINRAKKSSKKVKTSRTEKGKMSVINNVGSKKKTSTKKTSIKSVIAEAEKPHTSTLKKPHISTLKYVKLNLKRTPSHNVLKIFKEERSKQIEEDLDINIEKGETIKEFNSERKSILSKNSNMKDEGLIEELDLWAKKLIRNGLKHVYRKYQTRSMVTSKHDFYKLISDKHENPSPAAKPGLQFKTTMKTQDKIKCTCAATNTIKKVQKLKTEPDPNINKSIMCKQVEYMKSNYLAKRKKRYTVLEMDGYKMKNIKKLKSKAIAKVVPTQILDISNSSVSKSDTLTIITKKTTTAATVSSMPTSSPIYIKRKQDNATQFTNVDSELAENLFDGRDSIDTKTSGNSRTRLLPIHSETEISEMNDIASLKVSSGRTAQPDAPPPCPLSPLTHKSEIPLDGRKRKKNTPKGRQKGKTQDPSGPRTKIFVTKNVKIRPLSKKNQEDVSALFAEMIDIFKSTSLENSVGSELNISSIASILKNISQKARLSISLLQKFAYYYVDWTYDGVDQLPVDDKLLNSQSDPFFYEFVGKEHPVFFEGVRFPNFRSLFEYLLNEYYNLFLFDFTPPIVKMQFEHDIELLKRSINKIVTVEGRFSVRDDEAASVVSSFEENLTIFNYEHYMFNEVELDSYCGFPFGLQNKKQWTQTLCKLHDKLKKELKEEGVRQRLLSYIQRMGLKTNANGKEQNRECVADAIKKMKWNMAQVKCQNQIKKFITVLITKLIGFMVDNLMVDKMKDTLNVDELGELRENELNNRVDNEATVEDEVIKDDESYSENLPLAIEDFLEGLSEDCLDEGIYDDSIISFLFSLQQNEVHLATNRSAPNSEYTWSMIASGRQTFAGEVDHHYSKKVEFDIASGNAQSMCSLFGDEEGFNMEEELEEYIPIFGDTFFEEEDAPQVAQCWDTPETKQSKANETHNDRIISYITRKVETIRNINDLLLRWQEKTSTPSADCEIINDQVVLYMADKIQKLEKMQNICNFLKGLLNYYPLMRDHPFIYEPLFLSLIFKKYCTNYKSVEKQLNIIPYMENMCDVLPKKARTVILRVFMRFKKYLRMFWSQLSERSGGPKGRTPSQSSVSESSRRLHNRRKHKGKLEDLKSEEKNEPDQETPITINDLLFGVESIFTEVPPTKYFTFKNFEELLVLALDGSSRKKDVGNSQKPAEKEKTKRAKPEEKKISDIWPQLILDMKPNDLMTQKGPYRLFNEPAAKRFLDYIMDRIWLRLKDKPWGMAVTHALLTAARSFLSKIPPPTDKHLKASSNMTENKKFSLAPIYSKKPQKKMKKSKSLEENVKRSFVNALPSDSGHSVKTAPGTTEDDTPQIYMLRPKPERSTKISQVSTNFKISKDKGKRKRTSATLDGDSAIIVKKYIFQSERFVKYLYKYVLRIAEPVFLNFFHRMSLERLYPDLGAIELEEETSHFVDALTVKVDIWLMETVLLSCLGAFKKQAPLDRRKTAVEREAIRTRLELEYPETGRTSKRGSRKESINLPMPKKSRAQSTRMSRMSKMSRATTQYGELGKKKIIITPPIEKICRCCCLMPFIDDTQPQENNAASTTSNKPISPGQSPSSSRKSGTQTPQKVRKTKGTPQSPAEKKTAKDPKLCHCVQRENEFIHRMRYYMNSYKRTLGDRKRIREAAKENALARISTDKRNGLQKKPSIITEDIADTTQQKYTIINKENRFLLKLHFNNPEIVLVYAKVLDIIIKNMKCEDNVFAVTCKKAFDQVNKVKGKLEALLNLFRQSLKDPTLIVVLENPPTSKEGKTNIQTTNGIENGLKINLKYLKSLKSFKTQIKNRLVKLRLSIQKELLLRESITIKPELRKDSKTDRELEELLERGSKIIEIMKQVKQKEVLSDSLKEELSQIPDYYNNLVKWEKFIKKRLAIIKGKYEVEKKLKDAYANITILDCDDTKIIRDSSPQMKTLNATKKPSNIETEDVPTSDLGTKSPVGYVIPEIQKVRNQTVTGLERINKKLMNIKFIKETITDGITIYQHKHGSHKELMKLRTSSKMRKNPLNKNKALSVGEPIKARFKDSFRNKLRIQINRCVHNHNRYRKYKLSIKHLKNIDKQCFWFQVISKIARKAVSSDFNALMQALHLQKGIRETKDKIHKKMKKEVAFEQISNAFRKKKMQGSGGGRSSTVKTKGRKGSASFDKKSSRTSSLSMAQETSTVRRLKSILTKYLKQSVPFKARVDDQVVEPNKTGVLIKASRVIYGKKYFSYFRFPNQSELDMSILSNIGKDKVAIATLKVFKKLCAARKLELERNRIRVERRKLARFGKKYSLSLKGFKALKQRIKGSSSYLRNISQFDKNSLYISNEQNRKESPISFWDKSLSDKERYKEFILRELFPIILNSKRMVIRDEGYFTNYKRKYRAIQKLKEPQSGKTDKPINCNIRYEQTKLNVCRCPAVKYRCTIGRNDVPEIPEPTGGKGLPKDPRQEIPHYDLQGFQNLSRNFGYRKFFRDLFQRGHEEQKAIEGFVATPNFGKLKYKIPLVNFKYNRKEKEKYLKYSFAESLKKYCKQHSLRSYIDKVTQLNITNQRQSQVKSSSKEPQTKHDIVFLRLEEIRNGNTAIPGSNEMVIQDKEDSKRSSRAVFKKGMFRGKEPRSKKSSTRIGLSFQPLVSPQGFMLSENIFKKTELLNYNVTAVDQGDATSCTPKLFSKLSNKSVSHRSLESRSKSVSNKSGSHKSDQGTIASKTSSVQSKDSSVYTRKASKRANRYKRSYHLSIAGIPLLRIRGQFTITDLEERVFRDRFRNVLLQMISKMPRLHEEREIREQAGYDHWFKKYFRKLFDRYVTNKFDNIRDGVAIPPVFQMYCKINLNLLRETLFTHFRKCSEILRMYIAELEKYIQDPNRIKRIKKESELPFDLKKETQRILKKVMRKMFIKLFQRYNELIMYFKTIEKVNANQSTMFDLPLIKSTIVEHIKDCQEVACALKLYKLIWTSIRRNLGIFKEECQRRKKEEDNTKFKKILTKVYDSLQRAGEDGTNRRLPPKEKILKEVIPDWEQGIRNLLVRMVGHLKECGKKAVKTLSFKYPPICYIERLRAVRKALHTGKLPSQLISEMLGDDLQDPQQRRMHQHFGYVLDGYPRTYDEAEEVFSAQPVFCKCSWWDCDCAADACECTSGCKCGGKNCRCNPVVCECTKRNCMCARRISIINETLPRHVFVVLNEQNFYQSPPVISGRTLDPLNERDQRLDHVTDLWSKDRKFRIDLRTKQKNVVYFFENRGIPVSYYKQDPKNGVYGTFLNIVQSIGRPIRITNSTILPKYLPKKSAFSHYDNARLMLKESVDLNKDYNEIKASVRNYKPVALYYKNQQWRKKLENVYSSKCINYVRNLFKYDVVKGASLGLEQFLLGNIKEPIRDLAVLLFKNNALGEVWVSPEKYIVPEVGLRYMVGLRKVDYHFNMSTVHRRVRLHRNIFESGSRPPLLRAWGPSDVEEEKEYMEGKDKIEEEAMPDEYDGECEEGSSVDLEYQLDSPSCMELYPSTTERFIEDFKAGQLMQSQHECEKVDEDLRRARILGLPQPKKVLSVVKPLSIDSSYLYGVYAGMPNAMITDINMEESELEREYLEHRVHYIKEALPVPEMVQAVKRLNKDWCTESLVDILKQDTIVTLPGELPKKDKKVHLKQKIEKKDKPKVEPVPELGENKGNFCTKEGCPFVKMKCPYTSEDMHLCLCSLQDKQTKKIDICTGPKLKKKVRSSLDIPLPHYTKQTFPNESQKIIKSRMFYQKNTAPPKGKKFRIKPLEKSAIDEQEMTKAKFFSQRKRINYDYIYPTAKTDSIQLVRNEYLKESFDSDYLEDLKKNRLLHQLHKPDFKKPETSHHLLDKWFLPSQEKKDRLHQLLTEETTTKYDSEKIGKLFEENVPQTRIRIPLVTDRAFRKTVYPNILNKYLNRPKPPWDDDEDTPEVNEEDEEEEVENIE